jgi:hypothetical protein
MSRVVNLELLANPLNWIIVPLIVLFSVMALTFLQPYFGSPIPTQDN